MSLINKIKRAFGFDDDIDPMDDEDIAPSALPSALVRQHHYDNTVATPADKPSSPTTQTADAPVIDPAKATVIFEHVVQVFNESMPAFIKNSLDSEAQRKHLFDTLDQDIKDYINSLDATIEANVEKRWHSEKERLENEMTRLENQTRDVEAKRAELSQKQLSADRQKRALSERVNDLEKQVAALEAEKEQFDLENKSLMNKAKVVAVFEKENAKMREEINSLRAAALAGHPMTPAEPAVDNSAELNAKIDELNKQLDDVNKQFDDVKTEKELLEEELNDLKVKTQAIDEKNHQEIIEKARLAEQFESQVKAISQQIDQFEDVAKKKDKRIAELKEQLSVANATIEDLNAKASTLDTHTATNEMELTAAHTQIERLTNQVNEQNEQLASLKETLRIKDETYAASDKQLRQKIASLSDELDRANARERAASQVVESDISTYRQARSNVADILNDTDWLDAAPTKRRQRATRNDEAMHLPPQKNPDDPQMSLW